LIATAILDKQRCGNHLLANVGRIAHHDIKFTIKRYKQEIALYQPGFDQLDRRFLANSLLFEQAEDPPLR